ncbi:MAG: hypothetical protein JWO95_732, partial [Verrucomicrobiales bacterium]|nr:hypothetical protein [Verrucomicrobiales bacterium]
PKVGGMLLQSATSRYSSQLPATCWTSAFSNFQRAERRDAVFVDESLHVSSGMSRKAVAKYLHRSVDRLVTSRLDVCNMNDNENLGEGMITPVAVVADEPGVTGAGGLRVLGEDEGCARAVEPQGEGVIRPTACILKPRKRWGKIARLPFEIREWLNAQIRDGVQYAEIAAALAGKGFEGCTKYDLSTWKRGGHEDWLREQERVAALQNDLGQVFKALEKFGENHTDGVERITELLIGMQLAHAVQDLQRGTVKELVAQKPELFFRIARAASDQARDRARRKRVGLMVKKYDDSTAEQRAKEERKKNPEMKRGLSPETLRIIEAAMARM